MCQDRLVHAITDMDQATRRFVCWVDILNETKPNISKEKEGIDQSNTDPLITKRYVKNILEAYCFFLDWYDFFLFGDKAN
jgi:hypothetical protein